MKKLNTRYTIGMTHKEGEQFIVKCEEHGLKIAAYSEVLMFVVFYFNTKAEELKAFEIRYSIDPTYGTYKDFKKGIKKTEKELGL